MIQIKWFFYRLSYRFLQIILTVFRPLFSTKISEFVLDRKNLISKKSLFLMPQQNPIWFHSSSGEIEYIKPILRKIINDQPHQKIFLTYFSPSGKTMVEKAVKMFDEAHGYSPLPWDDFDSINFFLENLKPKMLVISRTDLWPELILQCHKRSIPVYLVAATFAPGSKKVTYWGRFFLELCMPYIKKVCLVSDEDQIEMNKYFSTTPSVVTGDPRYDQVWYRINELKKDLPNYFLGWKDENVWIAGSTWPEDENIIIQALQKLTLKNRLIIVPHETDRNHLKSIEALLQNAKIKYTFSSKMIGKFDFDPEVQVLIFDQKGFLLDLYRYSGIAVLGGSFKDQVHSVMEALGNGCKVIVGPHHTNNREAIEFQKILLEDDSPIVTTVTTAEEMAALLKKHFDSYITQDKKKVLEHFLTRTNAAEKTYNELFKIP